MYFFGDPYKESATKYKHHLLVIYFHNFIKSIFRNNARRLTFIKYNLMLEHSDLFKPRRAIQQEDESEILFEEDEFIVYEEN